MTSNLARAGRRRFKRLASLALVPVLAGGFVTATANAAAPEEANTPTLPSFVNGLSQAVFPTGSANWINYDGWVESDIDSDGDGLKDLVHFDVSRVRETDTEGLKVPVLMEISPYYAGGSNVGNWSVDHEIGNPPTSKAPFPEPAFRSRSPQISTSLEATWVPRGFAVVHAEGFGSGLSEGCPTTGGINESLAGKAVIDWLNGRAVAYTSPDRTTTLTADWATGSVGMTGTSYNGTLPIGTATTGVEGLDAIIPVAAISDWYEYYRANGAVRAAGGYQGEDADVLADYVHTRLDKSVCQPVIDDIRAKQDRVTGDYNEFWDERNYLNNADKIKAATLIVHGQTDWNVKLTNATRLWEKLQENNVPSQIFIHQGAHTGFSNDAIMNRWLTRYLWKVENGVEDLPKAYIVREGGNQNNPTSYGNFPVPGSAEVPLALNAAGTAGTIGDLTLNRSEATGTETIVDNATITVANLANAASSPNRLIYRTPVLTEDVHVSGVPRISVNLSVDRPKANLTAVLLRYNATGNPVVVTRGWMDVENRNSRAVTDPITPGEFYQFDFNFEPKDYIFPAGTRIGVMILSSDRDYTVRPAPGTTLTVDPSKSTFILPVVGGASAVAAKTGLVGAGTQVVTAAAASGALTLTSNSTAPVNMGVAELSGVDQFVQGTLNSVKVADARGLTSSWAVTGQVTDFVGENGVILADNLGWAPAASAVTGSLPSAPGVSTIVNPGDVAAPGEGLGSAKTLCSAPLGASRGTANCGGDLTLGIPGQTLLGTYSALLTLTLI